jgi:hypothetical protein
MTYNIPFEVEEIVSETDSETDSETESEQDFELNDLRLYKEFGDDFDFTLSINYDDLEEAVSDRAEIVIRNEIRMFEDLDNILTTDYHIIKSKNGGAVTLRDCIEQLIKQNVRTTGNHIFFEGVYKPPNTPPYIYEIMFGS